MIIHGLVCSEHDTSSLGTCHRLWADPLGRQHVLFRLPGLGVPHKPTSTTSANWQVFGVQRLHVGRNSIMLCSSPELLRRRCRTILSRRLRSCSNARYVWSIKLKLSTADLNLGFSLITSQWYRKSEQGFRTAFWFSFNGWAQIIGGFIAYGIAVGVRKHGAALAGWRIVFLWTGLLTAAVGILFWWVVPDNQLNARFLKKGDRVLAIERIRKNQQGVGNKHFKMYQLKEALTDPMV